MRVPTVHHIESLQKFNCSYKLQNMQCHSINLHEQTKLENKNNHSSVI